MVVILTPIVLMVAGIPGYNIYNIYKYIELVGGGFKHVLCLPQKMGK